MHIFTLKLKWHLYLNTSIDAKQKVRAPLNVILKRSIQRTVWHESSRNLASEQHRGKNVAETATMDLSWQSSGQCTLGSTIRSLLNWYKRNILYTFSWAGSLIQKSFRKLFAFILLNKARWNPMYASRANPPRLDLRPHTPAPFEPSLTLNQPALP